MKYFEARKGRIEIIPMIDIMFFLLVFFIMITLHMIPNAGLRTQLPASATTQELPPAKVTITLSDDGTISVDGRTMTTDELTAMLQARPDAAHTAVTIVGSKEARIQKLVSVMDACRAAGITQIAMAAQPAAN
jgi:biopolymer transport protein ExbD